MEAQAAAVPAPRPRHCPHFLQTFTVGGWCRECAPVAHAEYDELNACLAEAQALYTAETGKAPLEDWYAFELWLLKEAGRG